MSDRYAVFGHPIAHSKSPAIHAQFAHQTGQALTYEAILAPLNDFAGEVRRQMTLGLRGANVTVPFKEEAFRLADQLSARARCARAVNTLTFSDGKILGDNTDGAGLVADLTRNLRVSLAGRRILLLGAGGAARGVIEPLLAENPAALVIANRTESKAAALAAEFRELGPITAQTFKQLNGFDLVINATSASLSGDVPPLPAAAFAPAATAYDMMYGKGDTAFLAYARMHGVCRLTDGLGMLVGQAAEAFCLWRGVRPETAPVLNALRQQLVA